MPRALEPAGTSTLTVRPACISATSSSAPNLPSPFTQSAARPPYHNQAQNHQRAHHQGRDRSPQPGDGALFRRIRPLREIVVFVVVRTAHGISPPASLTRRSRYP